MLADHPQYCLMKISMKIDLQHILHVKNLRLSYPGAYKPHITRYGFCSMKQLGVFLLPNSLQTGCQCTAGLFKKNMAWHCSQKGPSLQASDLRLHFLKKTLLANTTISCCFVVQCWWSTPQLQFKKLLKMKYWPMDSSTCHWYLKCCFVGNRRENLWPERC